MKRSIYFLLFMAGVIVALPSFIVLGLAPEKTGQAGRSAIEEIKQSITEKSASDDREIRLKVYINAEKRTEEMLLEEYVKGVVAAEVPVEFEMEALKAQAVAARTYAYGRFLKLYSSEGHSDADVCTDVHCQVWSGRENIRKEWGQSADENWKKIEKAVDDTKDLVISYDGIVVNPFYHSNSGGKTENIEDVWGTEKVPYLKSVFSSGEEKCPSEFKSSVSIKSKDFAAAVKKSFPKVKLNESNVFGDIRIISRSEGGRVLSVKVGSLSLKGTEFRNIFSLRSANFSIEKGEGSDIKIAVTGNGHGVGMSQWGANSLAGEGKTSEEILKHYYTGVEIKNLHEID